MWRSNGSRSAVAGFAAPRDTVSWSNNDRRSTGGIARSAPIADDFLSRSQLRQAIASQHGAVVCHAAGPQRGDADRYFGCHPTG
jgi:hypothetical protein